DINYMARSGVLSQIKDEHGKPFVPAVQIADIFGGSMQAVQEILFALIERNQSGKGQHIDINMTGGVTPLLTLTATHLQGTSDENSFVLNGQHINYSIYQSKEGDHFALGALEPKFWNRFCEHIEKEEWKSRLLSNDKKHRDELKALFKSKDSDYWRKIEKAGDCCLSEVLDISKGIDKFPEFWSETSGGNKFPAAPGFNFWEAPDLGEDE
ncbi:MAG: CoA transferase, partial [Chitinophagales bacterium]